MSKPRSNFIAVDAGLAGKTIVEAIFARVQEIHLPDPPEHVGDALDDLDLAFVSNKEGAVEMQMRRKGYLAREVELELFEPARTPAPMARAAAAGEPRRRATTTGRSH